MDPTDVLSYVAPHLPPRWLGALACVAYLCNLITMVVKPPPAGSRWILPYRLVSAVALNVGWARNILQPGHDGPTTKPGSTPGA